MLQVIDTPGFGDSSVNNRTDFEQEELILKFVKQGITELNLVLITIRYGMRLEAGQVDTIMSVLRFLGRDMRDNSAILCTFAENASEENKKDWLEKLSISNAQNIYKYCNGKTFYTGMCIVSDEMAKEKFVKQSQKYQLQLINAAISQKPIKLSGDDVDKTTHQFKIYESAAKDSLTMKKLLPQILEKSYKTCYIKGKN